MYSTSAVLLTFKPTRVSDGVVVALAERLNLNIDKRDERNDE